MPPNLWSSIPGLNSDSSCQASEQRPPCSRPLWISARRSRGQKSPRPGADRQGWRRLWRSCDTRWCSPNLTIGSSSLRLSWIAFNNHLWSWSHFCHFHVRWSQRSPWSGVQLKVFCAFGSLDSTGMVLDWMWSRKDKKNSGQKWQRQFDRVKGEHLTKYNTGVVHHSESSAQQLPSHFCLDVD